MRWGGIIASIFLGAGALSAHAGVPVQIGDSDRDLQAKLGQPTRLIETDDGRLYFFGPTLVFVTRGAVDFISISPGLPAENIPPPAPEPSPPAPRRTPPSAAMPLTATSVAEATRLLRERDERQLRLASRTRLFAMTRAYTALSPVFHRALPMAMSDTGFGVQDARGRPLPTFGDNTWSPWYAVGVDLHDFILAE